MRKRRATLNKLILFDFLMKFVECVLVITLTKPIENNIPTKHHYLSTLLELNINPEGAQGALFNFFGPSENFLRIKKKNSVELGLFTRKIDGTLISYPFI